MNKTRIAVTIWGALMFGIFTGMLVSEAVSSKNENTLGAYGLLMGLGLGLMAIARWLPDR